ncbi:MAG: flagellar basal body P-ring protein FlgI [Planctomycetota bacterium]
MSSLIRFAMLSLVCLGAFAAPCRAEVRIKDITSVEGARANQLKGLGLVVGLNGTGARTLSTQQMAIDMLRKMDVTTKIARQSLLDNVFKSTSIAAVMVTTEIPPFARKGSRLDVVVSVIDDAISLEGGTLLLTPLEGADREVYAVAQGQVTIGGFNVRTTATGAQKNHPTVARLQGGAIVEREALGQIDQGGIVRFLLREPDYSTAKTIVMAINQKYPASAKAVDEGTIQARIPLTFARDLPEFVNEIGQLRVMPDTPARVIINERTGTVIVGHQVRISSVAIAHGNLVIKPNVTLTPAPDADGSTPLPGAPPPRRDASGDEIDDILSALKPRELPRGPQSVVPLTLNNVDQTFTVAELARILNALGVSPRDLIAIFQALKASGAMHAELVVI